MATYKVKMTKSAIQSKTSRHIKKQENITKTEKKYQPFKSDPELIEMPELGDMDKTVFHMFKKLTKDIEDVKKKEKKKP